MRLSLKRRVLPNSLCGAGVRQLEIKKIAKNSLKLIGCVLATNGTCLVYHSGDSVSTVVLAAVDGMSRLPNLSPRSTYISVWADRRKPVV